MHGEAHLIIDVEVSIASSLRYEYAPELLSMVCVIQGQQALFGIVFGSGFLLWKSHMKLQSQYPQHLFKQSARHTYSCKARILHACAHETTRIVDLGSPSHAGVGGLRVNLEMDRVVWHHNKRTGGRRRWRREWRTSSLFCRAVRSRLSSALEGSVAAITARCTVNWVSKRAERGCKRCCT